MVNEREEPAQREILAKIICKTRFGDEIISGADLACADAIHAYQAGRSPAEVPPNAPTPIKWHVLGDAHEGTEVCIEAREQRDRSTLYAVTRLGSVLNTDGEWEYEPLPSSRDDDFLARTRFASLTDAGAAVWRSAQQ